MPPLLGWISTPKLWAKTNLPYTVLSGVCYNSEKSSEPMSYRCRLSTHKHVFQYKGSIVPSCLWLLLWPPLFWHVGVSHWLDCYHFSPSLVISSSTFSSPVFKRWFAGCTHCLYSPSCIFALVCRLPSLQPSPLWKVQGGWSDLNHVIAPLWSGRASPLISAWGMDCAHPWAQLPRSS